MLLNWWRKKASIKSSSGKHTTRRPRKHVSARPGLEQLETRFLPAVSILAGANVNVAPLPANQHEASIALDPVNPNLLYATSNLDDPNPGLLGSFSTDGGKTWTHRTVATGSDLPGACCDSQAAFDNFGNLFLSYLGSDLVSSDLALSTDGGQTFTLLNTFANVADQPHLGVGGGSVWVEYNDNNNFATASGATVTGLGAVGAFTAPQEMPGGDAGNFGDITVGPSGAVLVSYQHDTTTNQADTIMVNLNPTGVGGTFGPAILATNTNVAGVDTNIPATSNNFGIDAEGKLAWDRSGGPHTGRVYLVYTDAPSPTSADTNIFLRHSDDNGATWSAPLRVNNDNTANSQFYDSIVIDQTNGDVAIQWYDCRNDLGQGGSGDTDGVANTDAQLFVAVSTDGGQSFASNIKVSTGTSNSADSEPPVNTRPLGFGDYEKTNAFNNGVFYPIWADNSNSTGDNPDGTLHQLDIYTAAVSIKTFTPPIVVSADAGGLPEVEVLDSKTHNVVLNIMAYDPSFRGGVRVAVGDINGDGVPDIITAPGPGGGPDIRVFDGATGNLIDEFMAYDPGWLGGVFVAAGDVNGDGTTDIITGPDAGGGPEVKVFNGKNFAVIRDFMAYNPFFLGGVRVAAGDVNGDSNADIITGAGPSGGPHVKVFSGANTKQVLQSFYAYDPNFSGGVYVAFGKFADGADIVTGAGAGGGPQVRVFNGLTGQVVQSFFAGATGAIFSGDAAPFHGGVRVAVGDITGNGVLDILVAFGPPHDATVDVFTESPKIVMIQSFLVAQGFNGGLFIGGQST